MEGDKKNIVGGFRKEDADAVPGSKQLPCSECGELTWISPSGQDMIQREDATVWCYVCFMKKVSFTDHFMPVEEKQLDEIQKVLGYRPTKEQVMRIIYDAINEKYTPSKHT